MRHQRRSLKLRVYTLDGALLKPHHVTITWPRVTLLPRSRFIHLRLVASATAGSERRARPGGRPSVVVMAAADPCRSAGSRRLPRDGSVHRGLARLISSPPRRRWFNLSYPVTDDGCDASVTDGWWCCCSDDDDDDDMMLLMLWTADNQSFTDDRWQSISRFTINLWLSSALITSTASLIPSYSHTVYTYFVIIATDVC